MGKVYLLFGVLLLGALCVSVTMRTWLEVRYFHPTYHYFSAVEVEFSNSLVRDRVKKTNRYCLERDIVYGKLFSSVTN